MCTSVPIKRAEEEVLKILRKLLLAWPDWVSRAVTTMRELLDQQFHAVPEQLAIDKRRLADVEKKIELILNDLEDPIARQSEALKQRLAQREAEATELRRRIAEADQAISASAEMPDETWIREHLRDMASLLSGEMPRAALLLRRLIGCIEASAVVAPGKKRGFARLTFRIRAWDLLVVAMEGRISEFVAEMVGGSAASLESPEFTIDLGRPSRMEEWAPKIAKMREQGVPWNEITKITGLGLGPAHEAWKRYVRGMNQRKDADGQQDQTAG